MFAGIRKSEVIALAGLTALGCAHSDQRGIHPREIYSRSTENDHARDIINKSHDFAGWLHQTLPRLETKHHLVVIRGQGLVSTTLPFGDRVQVDDRPASRVTDTMFTEWAEIAAKAAEQRMREYNRGGLNVEAVMITPHGYIFPLINGSYSRENIERLFPDAPSIRDVEEKKFADARDAEQRVREKHERPRT